MKITLLCIGKMKDPAQIALFEEYRKRLSFKLEVHELATADPLKEHASIEKALPEQGCIVGLDERGENFSSKQFAKWFGEQQLKGHSRMTFIIGGAEGLNDKIRGRCDLLISFGQMTWPHMLVRILLAEQLYRTQQILSGHPYHKE